MVEPKLIEQASSGDLTALIRLDEQGLILGSDETPAAYADRLHALKQNIAGMDAELRAEGSFTVEGMTVRADQRIPPDLLSEAAESTESLYRFRIDWVPGFFINPKFSLLFGGCAFYFYPDFFVLFIIRRVFAERTRWLIYGRKELLAHESCHVARIGLGSRLFEELFAYQTAPSLFRRLAGSLFRSPADSFAFLGSTLLLLLVQMLKTLSFPALPIWPFWVFVGLVAMVLLVRHQRLQETFRKAREHAQWLAPDAALPLLFRCTDAEVLELAALSDPAEADAWFQARCAEQARWKVISRRFCQSGEAAGAQKGESEPGSPSFRNPPSREAGGHDGL